MGTLTRTLTRSLTLTLTKLRTETGAAFAFEAETVGGRRADADCGIDRQRAGLAPLLHLEQVEAQVARQCALGVGLGVGVGVGLGLGLG